MEQCQAYMQRRLKCTNISCMTNDEGYKVCEYHQYYSTIKVCEAFQLNGQDCSCKVSFVTEEGLKVCGNHKNYKLADKEYIQNYLAEKEFEKMQKDFIDQLNIGICEGHECEIAIKNKYGLVVAFTQVDKEDHDALSTKAWHLSGGGYVLSSNGVSIHQIIMGKSEEGYYIDHIDGNRLNNRRSNLRHVSMSANNQNRPKKDSTLSRYIGLQKVKEKWVAVQGGKNLGTYDTEIEAARTYDTYVLLKYGSNAKTNGLVKLEEITVTLEDFERNEIRSLPTYISFYKYKGRETLYYWVQRVYNKKKFSKKFTALDEAVKYLDIVEKEIEKLQEQEEAERLASSITRNSNGDAIINIYDRSGKLVDEVIVDDDKYHELMKYSWSQKSLYCQTTVSKKVMLMHRYLMNAGPDQIVDHINGNKNDNRLCNLRFASFSINARNKEAKGSSKYLGVTPFLTNCGTPGFPGIPVSLRQAQV